MLNTILLIVNFLENLGNMLDRCCDTGKSWSAEKKSCNITLSFPLLNVAIEHSTMCLNVVGACCLHSLRYVSLNVDTYITPASLSIIIISTIIAIQINLSTMYCTENNIITLQPL